jgi:Flp pilus assembly protein CpaB
MEYAQKLMSTRAGTIAVAGGAALLAGIFILVYLNRYRHSVKAQGAPVTVLVAKRLIPKGTPGTALSSAFFTRTTIRQSQLLNGAFSDAASVRGRVAARDVLAGQQLTATDFTTSAKSLASGLSGTQRAIDVPLDSAHGMIGHIQAGDRVDVFVGFNLTTSGSVSGQAFPVSRLLAQGVPVIDVARKAGGFGNANAATNVSLRVNDEQAAAIAYAADNGKVWLALRPPTGAPQVRPGLVNVATILLGVPPVRLPSNGGKASRAITRQLQKQLASVGGH